MTSLLLRSADWVVTMDDAGSEIPGASLLIHDGVIDRLIAPAEALPAADIVIDARGMVLFPGLLTLHHHAFQVLARCVATAQSAGLEEWLAAHRSRWSAIDANAVRAAVRYVAGELLLSGSTTLVDHALYPPSGVGLIHEIEAAAEAGIRLVAVRGVRVASGTAGGSSDAERAEDVLLDLERLAQLHDPSQLAACQIAVGPSNLLAVDRSFAAELIAAARGLGLRGHTHVGETDHEESRFAAAGASSRMEYAERVGWVGPDIWFAHATHLGPSDLAVLHRTGSGVAHCPTSNMRLGNGIAPLTEWLRLGLRVGLGVDGSASNDSSSALLEARIALLAARAVSGPDAVSPRDVLRIATRGGADVLGRPALGRLVPGAGADVVGVRRDRPELAGAEDVVAAVVLCHVPHVDLTISMGEVRVLDGALVGADRASLAADVRRHALRLASALR
jgi:cytosine/adenosine deaminase-related metal-dependent hydrolase